MKRRNFLRNGLLGAFASTLPLAVSADQGDTDDQDDNGVPEPDVVCDQTVTKENESICWNARQVSVPRPEDSSQGGSDNPLRDPPGPSLTIGVPNDVPDNAPVYDASEYGLREAPAFSEAIENLSPDFEQGEYVSFTRYEHWEELHRHIATHSDDSSITAYYEFESHPDEERFFDFGDFVLNTRTWGLL